MAMYRKKPITVEAMQFTGDNGLAVQDWAGYLSDPQTPGYSFSVVRYALTRQVYDKLHDTWVTFAEGDWIIRGLKGEHYPCRPDVFEETYEKDG